MKLTILNILLNGLILLEVCTTCLAAHIPLVLPLLKDLSYSFLGFLKVAALQLSLIIFKLFTFQGIFKLGEEGKVTWRHVWVILALIHIKE